MTNPMAGLGGIAVSGPQAEKLLWPEPKLRRLAAAWNSGVTKDDLARRFGVAKNTIVNRLRDAAAAGIKVNSYCRGPRP